MVLELCLSLCSHLKFNVILDNKQISLPLSLLAKCRIRLQSYTPMAMENSANVTTMCLEILGYQSQIKFIINTMKAI